MTKTILCFSVLLLCGSLAAQDVRGLFEEGNQKFQEGKYQEAVEAYERLLGGGYESGELYYNLGNAYFKAGNIARSLLNYERARKLMPNDEDVRHNIDIVNLHSVDRIEPTPRLFIWDFWEELKGSFSLSGITVVTYLLYLIVLGSVAGIVLARQYTLRKRAFIASAVGAILFLPSLLIWIATIENLDRHDEAIVITEIVSVKNSPDSESSDAFVLHSGVKIWIADSLKGWFRIRLADGKSGWMEKSAAEII